MAGLHVFGWMPGTNYQNSTVSSVNTQATQRMSDIKRKYGTIELRKMIRDT